MRLFDDGSRTDWKRASRLEPEYEWWNRSARPEVAAVRKELSSWFSGYPQSQARALARRFRGRDDDHRSALFELYLFHHLKVAGFRVRCHPELAHSPNRPDFIVDGNRAPAVLIEATQGGPSLATRRAIRLKDEVIEAIDSLTSEKWLVMVLVEGVATASPPLRRTKFVASMQTWLDGLDASDERAENQMSWSHAGLSVTLTARPRPAAMSARGKGRLLASEASPAHFVAPGNKMITNALRGKVGRYRASGVPFVIAVNVLDEGLERNNIGEALKGIWGTAGSPKNTRLSGILLTTIWNPLSAVRRGPPVFIGNPGAAFPATEVGQRFPSLGDRLP